MFLPKETPPDVVAKHEIEIAALLADATRTAFFDRQPNSPALCGLHQHVYALASTALSAQDFARVARGYSRLVACTEALLSRNIFSGETLTALIEDFKALYRKAAAIADRAALYEPSPNLQVLQDLLELRDMIRRLQQAEQPATAVTPPVTPRASAASPAVEAEAAGLPDGPPPTQESDKPAPHPVAAKSAASPPVGGEGASGTPAQTRHQSSGSRRG